MDGTTVFNQTFNNNGGLQSYHNGSGSVSLQVVPTLSGISGLPGTDGSFTLYGSGFMDGATTLSVGGLTRVDQYVNQGDPTVSGARNDTLSAIVMPTAVESTVRVTTAGGYAQLTLPAQVPPPFVEFDAINATAPMGTPANGSIASAVVNQTITLTGRGFNNSTQVQFAAEDQTGAVGVLTREGSASPDGTSLTVVVPAEAVTGMVHVVGASGAFELQIVPTLRSVGGVIAPGQNILVEGSGLAAGQLTFSVGGQPSTVAAGVGARPVCGRDLRAGGGRDRTAGDHRGDRQVTTPGGSFASRSGATLATQPAPDAGADPGDTLTTATGLGLPRIQTIRSIRRLATGRMAPMTWTCTPSRAPRATW